MSKNEQMTESPQSESSSSSNQGLIMFKNELKRTKNELVFLGRSHSLTRTGTVRRANSFRRDSTKSISNEDIHITVKKEDDSFKLDKRKVTLESTYRHSLESISEYKTTGSFSTYSLVDRKCTSIDSPYSDCTDYASNNDFSLRDKKRFIETPESSYLSWIESVSCDYNPNTNTSTSTNFELEDAESKVGEWNNFWLNYQNSGKSLAPSIYFSNTSIADKTDDISNGSSTYSIKDFFDKPCENVFFTKSDVNELLKCSQKITDMLQNAQKRHENDEYKQEMLFSNLISQTSYQNSLNHEIKRERSCSGDKGIHEKFLKSASSTPSSFFGTLMQLNYGLADIIRRVMTRNKGIPDISEPTSPGKK